ncbi:hypothetical protein GYMLUDRAFT_248346 [Collybiopsis luxurians FD-317 M1]|uniref:Uncharacterized protein n=1 Tax=Collybiopsis luxurians FD-317 M1 TaxID=944289 RepID=A0A0D0AYH8_9AGAR|nr:hypothetical protein GYMLUDRAFT_248346 [Collybiopsis luxurians FD-317 M1]
MATTDMGTIPEMERQALKVIAELDHAISGSSPSMHLPGTQIERSIHTVKSIWRPDLPKPPSPIAETEVCQTPPVSGQTVGEESELPGPAAEAIGVESLEYAEAHTEEGTSTLSTKTVDVDKAALSTNEPSSTVVPGLISTKQEDPELEELFALVRARGIQYLHVAPEMKTEEVQAQRLEGNEDPPVILTKKEKKAAKHRAQTPSDSEENGKRKRSKSDNIGKQVHSSGKNSKDQKLKGKKANKDDDEDFIISDDEEVEGSKEYVDVTKSENNEPDQKQHTAEAEKDYPWRIAARMAMTDKWLKKGRKAWEKWCLDPVKNPILASIRNKAQTVAEYCPELGMTCAKLSLEVLTSDFGTTCCLAHSFS